MTYERRYSHRGVCAHLVPYYLALSDRAVCGVTVYNPRYDWHGSGSQQERDRAASMRLCSRCERIARGLALVFAEPEEAPVWPVSVKPAADRALSASPDRLLTTAAVAVLLGINAASVARWAKQRGVGAADRIQVQSSLVTHWSERAIVEASLRKPARRRRRVT